MVVAARPPRKGKPVQANKGAELPARPTHPAHPAHPTHLTAEDAARADYDTSLPTIFARRFNLVLDSARYPITISRRCTNVAYDFDVSAAAVRKWLVGEGLPSPAMMKRLAQHFSVSLDFLLGLSEQQSR